MKILFAIDDSTIQSIDLNFFNNLNLSESTELWLISVIDMEITSSPEALSPAFLSTQEIENSFIDKVRHNLNLVREKLENLGSVKFGIYTELLTGSPVPRILEKAKQNKFDLIILGSHYHTAFERFILGSVSDPILHRAETSVLVLKTQ